MKLVKAKKAEDKKVSLKEMAEEKIRIESVTYAYIRCPKSAAYDKRISGNAHRLLTIMYDCVLPDSQTENFWLCSVNRENLMSAANLSKNTYYKCIKELENAGYIVATKKGNAKSNLTAEYKIYAPDKCDVTYEVPEGSKDYEKYKDRATELAQKNGVFKVFINNRSLKNSALLITAGNETVLFYPPKTSNGVTFTKTERKQHRLAPAQKIAQKNYEGTGKHGLCISGTEKWKD